MTPQPHLQQLAWLFNLYICSSQQGSTVTLISMLLMVIGSLKKEMSMISKGFSTHTLSILFPINWNSLPHNKSKCKV